MSRFRDRQGPIQLGMVGGGQGAFIGGVHRFAARLDGHFQLVAGALSSTPEKARASGAELGLTQDRSYDDFALMAESEAERADGIEAVAIVTPNHMHLPAARAFLERGIHVICDKPLTTSLADAAAFRLAVTDSDALFVLTHNYTAYPMVRQARAMVAAGEIGSVRLVQVEYAQDWLTEALDAKQADWRTDPARSGAGGATGDIGTHAIHLARFVSGLELESLSADLQSFVSGRRLDDNANVLLRFAGGARGMLWCSQVAPGNENALRLRIYGDKGGLDWQQEQPNELWHSPYGEPKRLLTRGGPGAGEAANRLSRIPGGHPEGYLEGFANLYAEAAAAIRAHREGTAPEKGVNVSGISDGLFGMAFIDACVNSSHRGSTWIEVAAG